MAIDGDMLINQTRIKNHTCSGRIYWENIYSEVMKTVTVWVATEENADSW